MTSVLQAGNAFDVATGSARRYLRDLVMDPVKEAIELPTVLLDAIQGYLLP